MSKHSIEGIRIRCGSEHFGVIRGGVCQECKMRVIVVTEEEDGKDEKNQA